MGKPHTNLHVERVLCRIEANAPGFCHRHVYGMLGHLERRGIIASADDFYADLDLKVSCARNRVRSYGGARGGKPRMSIGIAEAIEKFVTRGGMIEYPSFENDPVIGRIWTSDPYDVIRGILAHELAHAIQFTIGHGHASPAVFCRYQGGNACNVLPIKERRRPHGQLFKAVYAELRINCVNGNLPDQEAARASAPQAMAEFLSQQRRTPRVQLAADSGEPVRMQTRTRSKAKGRNLGVCASLRDFILEGLNNHEAAARVRERIPLSRATNRDAQIERRGLRKMGYDV